MYLSVARMAIDSDLLARITGCAAIEGESNPEVWTRRNRWAMAAQPGWAAAWDYGIASDEVDDETLGSNPGVISDAMILSAVQSIRS